MYTDAIKGRIFFSITGDLDVVRVTSVTIGLIYFDILNDDEWTNGYINRERFYDNYKPNNKLSRLYWKRNITRKFG